MLKAQAGKRACLRPTRYVYNLVCLQSHLYRGIDIQDRQLQSHARLCDVRQELASSPVHPHMTLAKRALSRKTYYWPIGGQVMHC